MICGLFSVELRWRHDCRVLLWIEKAEGCGYFPLEQLQQIDSTGFWRWCIILGISEFLDLIQCPLVVSSFLRTQQNRILPPFHLRTETDPVYETLRSLEYQTTDKVQILGNPEHQ
jgi:hypothetical protein